jgi:hypothetical protein
LSLFKIEKDFVTESPGVINKKVGPAYQTDDGEMKR